MSRDDKFESEEFKALLVARDTQAWDELYLHIKSRLVGHIVNGLGGEARYQPDAEEILNEVVSNAFKSYRGECPPIYYLFILANNAVRNRRKKKKEHDDLDEDLRDWRPDPEKECEEKEVMEIIKSLIKILPPMPREVLKRSFLKGLKNCEIAEILGISKNYVGVCINRGTKQLRELFEDRVKKVKECNWRDISVSEGARGACVVKRVRGAVARMKTRPVPDDIIVKVADKPVANVTAFAQITKEVEASKDVILIVIRVKERDEKVEITVPGARDGNGRSFSRKLT